MTSGRSRCACTGVTLVELCVVMAVIGLLSLTAIVYLSAGDTRLKSAVANLKFDLEQARQEAVKRNTTVAVAFSKDLDDVDCNNDGVRDSNDSCYVIYEDREGTYVHLRVVQIEPSIDIETQTIVFRRDGTSTSSTVTLATEVRNENCPVDAPCLKTWYDVTTNHIGRISVSEPQQQCATCTE